MAQNVFDPTIKRTVFLDIFKMSLPGHFKADTVEVTPFTIDGNISEFAVFVVAEPDDGKYPHRFVGEYRIPVCNVKKDHPDYFIGYVPPEPEAVELPACAVKQTNNA